MGLLSSIIDPVASYYEGKARYRGAKKGAAIAEDAYNASDAQAANQLAQQNALFDPYSQYGAQGRSALAQMLGDEENFSTPDFQYSGSVNDYIDPAMKFKLNAETMAHDQSAASQGRLFNTGYEKEQSDYSQGLASDEYKNAFQALMQDRGSQLSRYQALVSASQNARQQRLSGLEGMVSTGMAGDANRSANLNNYYSTLDQNAQGRASTKANLAMLKEQNKSAFPLAVARSIAGIGDAGLDYASGNGGLSSIFGNSSGNYGSPGNANWQRTDSNGNYVRMQTNAPRF